MAAPGVAINDYLERTFGRFVGDRATGEPPLTPWTPMPQPGLDQLQSHLSDYYEIEVRSLAPLDCGVVRVDRRDKVRWIARVFPPARSAAATEADIGVLRWLAAHDMPAERLAHDEPLTWVDGHAVVVTEFAPGKPISQTRATSEWMGETLGRLHALPLHGAPEREGGGWHHLSLNGGGRTQDIALLHDLLTDVAARAPKSAEAIAELRSALDSLDLGTDLPEAMVHVDFGGPNVLRDKDRYTVIDWTGAGRAPRIAALASVVAPQGDTALDVIVGAYRSHITPTAEELERIEAMMLTHQLVLAAWGALFDATRAADTVARLDDARGSAAKKAARLRRAFES
ncbi:MAG TPA: phosphotransferase [Acidimicrobiales bacterium]|nr:phosphotransferase [Acidimicrobiales bacterium]